VHLAPGNTDPGIADLKNDTLVRILQADNHSTLMAILEGVANQIQSDLLVHVCNSRYNQIRLEVRNAQP
jgi:hypothetical protein